MEMDSEEKIRAFLALPLAEAFEVSVRPLMGKLKAQFPEVKWVDPSQIHLTLHFFGDIGLRGVEKISRVIPPLVQTAKPVHLLLRGVGGFPNYSQPRIIWAGIEGEVEPLALFHSKLESELKQAGFICEKRDFKPHLTLGRVREGKKAAPVKNILLGPTDPKQVSEIILYKSILTPAGPQYEKLQTFPLSAA